MKGYIYVDIPTKKYIKAYLNSQYPGGLLMNRDTVIGGKLEDLLRHQTNEDKNRFSTRYNCNVRVYISIHVHQHRGSFLNHTNVKNFNTFVEKLIKDRFYQLMDDAVEVFPSFEANIDSVRIKLGITEDDWSHDSMKKDYYRYRLAKGKPLFYKKTFAACVPSMPLHQFAF